MVYRDPRGFPWEFVSKFRACIKVLELTEVKSFLYCQFETMAAAYNIINIDIDTTGFSANKDQICRIYNEMGHEHDSFSRFLLHSLKKFLQRMDLVLKEGP